MVDLPFLGLLCSRHVGNLSGVDNVLFDYLNPTQTQREKSQSRLQGKVVNERKLKAENSYSCLSNCNNIASVDK